jgi:NADH-quinone oxidoreductase subunit D
MGPRYERGRFGMQAAVGSMRQSDKPHRVKMSTGSFKNPAALPFLLKGVRIGDMPIIYGSPDHWPKEADR